VPSEGVGFGDRGGSSISGLSGPLVVALLAGCENNVRRIFREARTTGADLARISIDLVEPALSQIGEMWVQHEISIAEEHLATLLVTRLIANAAESPVPRRAGAPRIVLACLSGEFHELGLRIISEVAREAGWEPEELGANVPRAALTAFLGQRPPQAVGLSISLPGHIPECGETIRLCRKAAPAAKVLVGGRIFRVDPDLGSLLDADFVVPDVVSLRDWLRTSRRALSRRPASPMPARLTYPGGMPPGARGR
jgi:MerR family transcriptional regulator, light-induced transcriptional regulator